MRVGIFVKADRTDFAGPLGEILTWIQKRVGPVVLDERVASALQLNGFPSAPPEKIQEAVDLTVVFGGDGTLLSVARLVSAKRAPILGVNLGTLGFLTGVTLDELSVAFEAILAGRHRIDSRRLLKARILNPDDSPVVHYALNDVVVNNGILARMICMDVWINGDFTSQFLADGIILSSPTGSTAYSLSAGGPILYPTLDAVTLTPICPHTLTHRPLVIPAEAEVRIKLKAGEDVTLTIDGQVGVRLRVGADILCTESEYKVDLVQPSDRSFFDVLRQKFKWGERWQSR